MADLAKFNASRINPASRYEPLPAGQYAAVVTNSRMKPTKSGRGSYLELTFRVIEGQHKGRLLWARLNLDNPSAQAVEIAQGELSAICRAVGVMRPRDSSELHDIPLSVTVICRHRQDTGELTNEIRGYGKWEEVGAVSRQHLPSGSPSDSNLREPGMDPEVSQEFPAQADTEDLPF
jgi:hypothetical protein